MLSRTHSQMKQLGQRRLDTSLSYVKDHRVWSHGLGIMSHLAPLRAELLVDDEAEDESKANNSSSAYFEYLEDASENPATNPSLFQPCCSLHPGCCRSNQHWGKIMRMVQQFEIGCENNKVSACQFILHLRVDKDMSGAQSSNAKSVVYESWSILGSVAKRPLVHIMGMLKHDSRNNRMLIPKYEHEDDVSSKRWELHTSHELFSDVMQNAHASDMQRVDVTVKFFGYDAIGAVDVANHFRVAREHFGFTVGTHVVVARLSTPKPAPVVGAIELGFGLKVTPTTKRQKHRAPAPSSSSRPPPIDRAKFKSSEAGVAAVSDDGPQNFSSPALQEATDQDSNPTELSAIAQQEFDRIKDQLSGHMKDAEADDGANTQTRTETSTSSKQIRFTCHTGIIGLKFAQRTMHCCVCNQRISRGDYRFEYSASTKKPPRSMHPECVGMMEDEKVAPSLAWLKSHQHDGSAIQKEIVQRATVVLEVNRSIQKVQG